MEHVAFDDPDFASRSMPKIKFTDWCGTGFKVGINDETPKMIPGGDIGNAVRSCCLIANNTAVKRLFNRLNNKFDLLYSQKAFVHWYVGAGLEQEAFQEARENLEQLEKEYDEMELNSGENDFSETAEEIAEAEALKNEVAWK